MVVGGKSGVLACILLVAAVLAGCGESSGGDGSAASERDTGSAATSEPEAATEERPEQAPDPEPEPEPTGVVIKTAESQFGEVLFSGRDQAIYYFDLEQGPRPRCYGSCAAAWPPVLTDGAPRAGGQVRAGLLGTTERRDGTVQATYRNRPLYYYVDEGPGELRCHNIFHEGGLWLAVQSNGQPVPHDPAQTVSLD